MEVEIGRIYLSVKRRVLLLGMLGFLRSFSIERIFLVFFNVESLFDLVFFKRRRSNFKKV